jgi:hypothetical protein
MDHQRTPWGRLTPAPSDTPGAVEDIADAAIFAVIDEALICLERGLQERGRLVPMPLSPLEAVQPARSTRERNCPIEANDGRRLGEKCDRACRSRADR